MRLREAIAVAAPQAARAVTVAGLALAASFALLAIVPLRLVPRVRLRDGRGRADRHLHRAHAARAGADVAVRRARVVAGPAGAAAVHARVPRPRRRARRAAALGDAQRATDAALVTLSERITPRETHVLAAQLPRDLRPSVRAPPGATERFGAEEFVRRVGEREGVDDDEAAGAHARGAAHPRRRRGGRPRLRPGPALGRLRPPVRRALSAPLSPRAARCANMQLSAARENQFDPHHHRRDRGRRRRRGHRVGRRRRGEAGQRRPGAGRLGPGRQPAAVVRRLAREGAAAQGGGGEVQRLRPAGRPASASSSR